MNATKYSLQFSERTSLLFPLLDRALGTVAHHSQVDRANAITPGRTKPFMLRTILRPQLLDLLIHHQIVKPEAS